MKKRIILAMILMASLSSVKAADEITLDEDATEYPTWLSEQYNTIKVNRTLTQGQWNTVCFPFSMTAEEISNCFGSDTKIKKVTDITDEDVVVFEDATELKALSYYIVKPGKDVTTFVLNKKILSNWNGDGAAQDKEFDSQYTIESCDYARTAGDISLDEAYFFILSNGKFYHLDENVDESFKIKGYRWDIYYSGDLEGEAKSLKCSFDLDDTTTGVAAVKVKETNTITPTYNIAGQHVGNDYKGLVIKNGKKFIKK